jgi:hypothetical protein
MIKSPGFDRASICLLKIKFGSKSFDIAVIALVSVVKESAGSAILFFLSLTVSSVAKCCESAALPPLPKINIFFFV